MKRYLHIIEILDPYFAKELQNPSKSQNFRRRSLIPFPLEVKLENACKGVSNSYIFFQPKLQHKETANLVCSMPF